MVARRTPAGPSVSVGSWFWLIADSAVSSFALPSVLHSLSSGNGPRCGSISPPAGATPQPHITILLSTLLTMRLLGTYTPQREQPALEDVTPVPGERGEGSAGG